MARQRIQVKNMRVGVKRIPDGVFRAVASELIDGPEPELNARKNGAPSKAQVAVELCETDPAFRKRFVAACGRKMADEVVAKAAESGLSVAPAEPTFEDRRPRLPNGEVDYVSLVADIKAATEPSPAIMLCGTCARESCSQHRPAT